jgi:hypothetical protein
MHNSRRKKKSNHRGRHERCSEENDGNWRISNTITPYSRYVLEKYIENSHLDIYQVRQMRLMIDILLIYPSLTVEERYGRRGLNGVGGNLPPLGIAQLASSLESRGFSTGLIDAVVLNMDENDVLNEIEKNNPRAVGISAVTPIFHRAAALSGLIRERFPSILIVLGGHHATIVPEQVLEGQPCIDIIGCGEGENTLCEIMENTGQKSIPAIAFSTITQYLMESRE